MILVLAMVVFIMAGALGCALVGIGLMFFPRELQLIVLVLGLTYLAAEEIVSFIERKRDKREDVTR